MMRPAKTLRTLPGDGPVKPQELMGTVAENYGLCRENAETLTGLQQWISKQREVGP